MSTQSHYNLFELCMTIPEFVAAVKPALFPPHPLVALLDISTRPHANCYLNQHIPSWNRFLDIIDKFHCRATSLRYARRIARIQDGTYTALDIEYVHDWMAVCDFNRGQHNVEIAKLAEPEWLRRYWERDSYALVEKYGNYIKYIEAIMP